MNYDSGSGGGYRGDRYYGRRGRSPSRDSRDDRSRESSAFGRGRRETFGGPRRKNRGGVRDRAASARNNGLPGWANPSQDRQMPASRDARCAICRSDKHETETCCKLNGPYPLTERRQGFKRWCPRHQIATHTMDQCKQKWDWIRDEKQVTRWLVLSCVLGPAFATNLIDWRTLLDTKLPDVNFILFPWTPEFALQKMRDSPDFHEQKCHEVDPRTASVEVLRNAGWQTENGQEPQFKIFAELKAHAEQEYQKSQMKRGKNRPYTENIMKEGNACQMEEPEIAQGSGQAFGEQEVASLQENAVRKPRIIPILGPLMQDPFKGCHSVFLSGYEFCTVPLILSLWEEWSKNKELESDFVVLAATSRKTTELRMMLRESQQKEAVENSEERVIDVQAAAKFLNNKPTPGKRYIIIVDTLFPNLFTLDHSTYVCLQQWIVYSNGFPNWARMCLLQPAPNHPWPGKCTMNVTCSSFDAPPKVREMRVRYRSESDEALVAAISTELDIISRTMRDIRAVIIYPGFKFAILYELLPKLVSKVWCVQELYTAEQGQNNRKIEQQGRRMVFFAPMGIQNVTPIMDGLGAILCIDPQERPAFHPFFRELPIMRSNMDFGEIEYCRRLLMRYANETNAPLLYHFETQGNTSPLKRKLFLDPLTTVFQIIGILKRCRLSTLSKMIDWLEPHELCIYVNWLIDLSLLQDDQPSGTRFIYTLERDLKLRDNRAEETYRLMMEADRTDLSFCWLEAGINPPAHDGVDKATMDATRALTRLIVLLRPRPEKFGILIDLETDGEDMDEETIIFQRINAILPQHLHSWVDKGAPWMLALLYDSVMKDMPFLTNDSTWIHVSPYISAKRGFLRSVFSDVMRIASQSCFWGPLFGLGNGLHTEQHVNACYESVTRHILDAFSHRLVLIRSVDIVNPDNIEVTYTRGFEYSTGIAHLIEGTLLNRVLLRRHCKPDGTFNPMFAIYFKLSLVGENSIIDDVLIIPDNVVTAWRHRTGIEFERWNLS
ncbi:hypothetical protein F4782DRAFT_531178 [Xylaria castorea]|nr:hypothetical protein F4782DRAFT_531178 [Xylaria castorea]